MLIFNFDDINFSQGVNERFLVCVSEKIISSATCLANFEKYVLMSRENLSFGLHLNFVEGKASKVYCTLTDDSGVFFPKRELVKRLIVGRIKKTELIEEAITQLSFLLDHGVNVTHFDSHQNTHFLPPILETLVEVGRKYGVKKVRGQSSIYDWFASYSPVRKIAKKVFETYWQFRLPNEFRFTQKIILNAPGLGCMANENDLDKVVYLWKRALLRHYNPKIVYEVPCHPHLSELEYNLYCYKGFRKMLEKTNVAIGGYHDL